MTEGVTKLYRVVDGQLQCVVFLGRTSKVRGNKYRVRNALGWSDVEHEVDANLYKEDAERACEEYLEAQEELKSYELNIIESSRQKIVKIDRHIVEVGAALRDIKKTKIDTKRGALFHFIHRLQISIKSILVSRHRGETAAADAQAGSFLEEVVLLNNFVGLEPSWDEFIVHVLMVLVEHKKSKTIDDEKLGTLAEVFAGVNWKDQVPSKYLDVCYEKMEKAGFSQGNLWEMT